MTTLSEATIRFWHWLRQATDRADENGAGMVEYALLVALLALALITSTSFIGDVLAGSYDDSASSLASAASS